MFKTIINAFKVKDVRNKILITLALLFVYVLGTWIPVPGINTEVFKESTTGDFLGLLSALSGGALSQGAILALGVSPYITASIVLQLLTFMFPKLQRISKQSDGRKKINFYTRILSLVLAVAQAVGIVLSFNSNGTAIKESVLGGQVLTIIFVVLMLVAGAMFTVWLSEKITDIGIGNGMNLLIFVGILSTASITLLDTIVSIFNSNIDALWQLLIFMVAVVLIFGLITFIDLAERRVPVQYAKQVKGRKMYGGQSTFIPIKVNSSGVLPIIFAMAFITFPQLIMSIFWPSSDAYTWYATNMGAGTWPYFLVATILIFFFSFFYSQMSFNTEDISKQIQQNGGFITGIRPGKPTADHLKKISNRIILFGAFFLSFMVIVPTIIFISINLGGLISAFSATGMLIIVSSALELNKQIEAQMLMKNYRGFLK